MRRALYLSIGLPIVLADVPAEDEVGLFQRASTVSRREGCADDDEVGLLQRTASLDRREDPKEEEPFRADPLIWDKILAMGPLAPAEREDGLPPALCKDHERAHYLSFGTDPRLFPEAGCPMPDDELLMTPFSKMKLEPGQKHSCLLFPSCARAQEAGKLSIYSRGYGGPWCGTAGVHETPWDFDNGVIKAPAGSHVADGEYCFLNGWLDLPNAKDLHKNATAIHELAEETCKTIPQEMQDSWTMSKVLKNWDVALVTALREAKNPPGQQKPLFDEHLLQNFNAGYCASNTLPCVIDFCTDWFCRLADGRIGSGCQCKDDFEFGFES